MRKLLLRLLGPVFHAILWRNYHLRQRDASVDVLIMGIKRRDPDLALRARNTLFTDRQFRDVSHEVWMLLEELQRERNNHGHRS